VAGQCRIYLFGRPAIDRVFADPSPVPTSPAASHAGSPTFLSPAAPSSDAIAEVPDFHNVAGRSHLSILFRVIDASN